MAEKKTRKIVGVVRGAPTGDAPNDIDKIVTKYHKEVDAPQSWPPKEFTLRVWDCADFRCAVAKNEHFGNINGYVLLPKDHPDAGKYCGDDSLDIDVHGGLTFCQQDLSGGWWFGWDTAHYMDFVPSLVEITGDRGGIKWTEDMVVKETERLARQFRKRGVAKCRRKKK